MSLSPKAGPTDLLEIADYAGEAARWLVLNYIDNVATEVLETARRDGDEDLQEQMRALDEELGPERGGHVLSLAMAARVLADKDDVDQIVLSARRWAESGALDLRTLAEIAGQDPHRGLLPLCTWAGPYVDQIVKLSKRRPVRLERVIRWAAVGVRCDMMDDIKLGTLEFDTAIRSLRGTDNPELACALTRMFAAIGVGIELGIPLEQGPPLLLMLQKGEL